MQGPNAPPPKNDTDINEIFALLVFFPYIQEFLGQKKKMHFNINIPKITLT